MTSPILAGTASGQKTCNNLRYEDPHNPKTLIGISTGAGFAVRYSRVKDGIITNIAEKSA